MPVNKVKVGTFNINNLFSRFNFKADVDTAKITDLTKGEIVAKAQPKDVPKLEWVYRPGSIVWVRQFQGKIIKSKPDEETEAIAKRIKAMDVDVLAVQEVEDKDTLKGFNEHYLGGMYPHTVLVEGNDPRLIDVAVLSKLPLGRVTSWQRYTYPAGSNDLIFSRDMLEVEIWDKGRDRKLFTLFVNHLKSQYVPPGENPVAGKEENDKRRIQQAEAIAQILKDRAGAEPFILLGDMNDGLGSAALQAFQTLNVVNALANAQETQPLKKVNPPPPTAIWTHRFGGGASAKYELYDQIWLSQALKDKLTGAFIGRRETLTTLAKNGSDHDPAWIVLEL